MTRLLPVLAALALLAAVCGAQAQSVTASALAGSLVGDLQSAQTIIDRGLSPWPEAQSRPQAEPVRALSQELPGFAIWKAFRPVDLCIREAFRQQRKMFCDKDAGLIDCRHARAGLPALADAIASEARCYPEALISQARRQVDRVDYALQNRQYNAALCVMWAMANDLGLWDRQAALEVVAQQLGLLRARGLRRTNLRAGEARWMKARMALLANMVERAVSWQAANDHSAAKQYCRVPAPVIESKQWVKDHMDSGGAYVGWRTKLGESGATPFILNKPIFRLGLQDPPRPTNDLSPCPGEYRDWQYRLGDYRYGWLVYNHSAANGLLRPHGDWRDLQPRAFWPGAQGSDAGGGL